MAIITAESYQALTDQTLTGTALTACRGWCSAVSSALLQALKPFHPEPITITDAILDAPPSRDLVLPVRPVRSIISVYYRSDANGVVSAFTSDDLLDNTDGDEYQLLIDDPINSWARAGILRRVGWTVWGYENVTLPTRLAPTLGPERGSIKVTYLAGPSALPPEIEAGASLAVSMLLNRKTTGVPFASESWNGESHSVAGNYLATSVVHSPDVQAFLMPYMPGLRIA